jgi:hypothetical protein
MPKRKPPQDPSTPNVVIPPSRLASKQTQRLLDQIVAANYARKNNEQEQLIALRPLIMCGIPLRRLKESYYVRQSGPYTVELISSPLLGVPYGQDRLIPIFLASLDSHPKRSNACLSAGNEWSSSLGVNARTS